MLQSAGLRDHEFGGPTRSMDENGKPRREPDEWGGERGRREPGDDFFCLRFHVWYPSFDCAIRTKFRTAAGCARCDQGLFNLKRHAAALQGMRFPAFDAAVDDDVADEA